MSTTPTFEVGKKYRTRGGWEATVVRIDADGCMFVQHEPRLQSRWHQADGGHILDFDYCLIPGAIEDAPIKIDADALDREALRAAGFVGERHLLATLESERNLSDRLHEENARLRAELEALRPKPVTTERWLRWDDREERAGIQWARPMAPWSNVIRIDTDPATGEPRSTIERWDGVDIVKETT